jgi:Fic family protein
VAAPHEDLPRLMADLFAFVGRDDLDAVTQAAVAHAQFETIHPFADGNGRLGRVLVGRILAHRLGVDVPPPVSLQLARDRGGYLSGLALYRQGHVDTWVRWFAGAVEAAADRSSEVLVAVDDLQVRWARSLASLRLDAAARRLVHHLPSRPAISVAGAAVAAGVSEQAARVAIGQLVERGILREAAPKPFGPGRPRRWWVADDLLALFS